MPTTTGLWETTPCSKSDRPWNRTYMSMKWHGPDDLSVRSDVYKQNQTTDECVCINFKATASLSLHQSVVSSQSFCYQICRIWATTCYLCEIQCKVTSNCSWVILSVEACWWGTNPVGADTAPLAPQFSERHTEFALTVISLSWVILHVMTTNTMDMYGIQMPAEASYNQVTWLNNLCRQWIIMFIAYFLWK